MSYCVNCGVELEKSLKSCPLCSTPVINPNQPEENISLPPFPTGKGTVDPVNKTDTLILITVVLISTAIACGLLNLLLLNQYLWSLYIIGICALLWIFFIPFFSPRHISAYVASFLNGIGVALYCGLIAIRHPGRGWYTGLALPIIVLATVLLCIFTYFMKHYKTSILSAAVVIFTEIPILCIGIELFIHNYHLNRLFITWSAIVLTCCAIIVATLSTIIKRNRLREEVRKRLHL